MNIFYDYQILVSQKYGGISKYFYELISQLNDIDNVNAMIKVKGNINEYFKESLGEICKARYGYSKKVLENYNKLSTLIELKKGYDIVHPTYYAPYILKYAKNNKIVITVHDMIQELYPQFLGGVNKVEQVVACKKQFIYDADAVIAISESTKNDILQLYPEVKDKISVVHHGVTEIKPIRPDFELPSRYILFVGNRDGYKNFKVLQEAFSQLAPVYQDLHLICVGGGGFSREELNIFKRYQNRIRQCFCSEGELAYLYKNAEAYIFPSIYEGFGMPILEAFIQECPVLLSDNKCFKEIAGEAALYFDASNAEELANVMKDILDNSERRKRLGTLGKQRVSKYTWEKTAYETLKVYRSSLD